MGSETSAQDAPVEAATPEAMLYAGEDRGDGELEEAGPGHDQEREDGRDETIGAVVAQWGRVIQDLKDRKQALTATVFAEGVPSSFQDGVLEVAFPKESDFYAKEAGKPRHGEALGEILERRFGARPRLEFRVAGADGPAPANSPNPKTPAEGADDFAPPPGPRPSRDVPEVAPEAVPEPEAEEPRGGTPDGADAAPALQAEDEPRGEIGERAGADDTIRDSREVLAMAQELFGPDGGLTGDKQNGDD